MKNQSLTPKQQQFVTEYVRDFNITQASLRVGYAPGHGWRLLQNPAVAEAIEQARQEQAQARQAVVGQITDQLLRVISLDPREIMTWGPNGVTLKDSAELPPEIAACVDVSISETSRGTMMRVKLHDRRAALRELAHYLGLEKPARAKDDDRAKTEGKKPRVRTQEELCHELRATLRALEGDGITGGEPESGIQ